MCPIIFLKLVYRLYSEVSKSTRAKVAVTFAHFLFSVITFCVLQPALLLKQAQILIVANTESGYTKPEAGKNDCHLCPC
jgi:uncharacterized membrane protein